ncbi:AraC family transcriptional regulator [Aeromicrobium sp. NPDC092404]|uniref:AraC family transcriptional regulator n=1 Tax=Aeromicrobium sp. NPDC092404 TaxID=3154976 RepID=UPI00341CF4C2
MTATLESLTASTPWTPVEPLTEALFRVRMHGVFYSWTRATEPLAVDMPRLPDCLSFHVVTAGDVWITVAGHDPVRLEPGDIALVPRGLGHALASDLGVPSAGQVDTLPQEMVSDHYSVMTIGDPDLPVRTAMLCGVVGFDSPAVHEVLQLLPPLIHVRRDEGLSGLVALMVDELERWRPGGEAVTTRLADVLVVQAIRTWLESDPHAEQGWIAALRDPWVGRSVAAIHREPGRPWTLGDLAAEAALSRSAFAERFTRVVGTAPMQYVTTWRMNVAAVRLAEGASVAEVAAALGYGSVAAFSRAYKRTRGTNPGSDRSRR